VLGLAESDGCRIVRSLAAVSKTYAVGKRGRTQLIAAYERFASAGFFFDA